MDRKAKIVATLGPSTQTEPVIKKLIAAGMDVARLNFSHGTHEEHAERIRLIRRLAREIGKPVTILQDLQGPKIRVGDLPAGPVELVPGEKVVLASELPNGSNRNANPPAGEPVIPMDFPGMPQYVQIGSHILLDDGQRDLEVTAIGSTWVEARVQVGGTLTSHKGVNLPGAVLPIPSFTEKDRADLAFGLEQGIDALAISFVHSAADIEIVRGAIQEMAPNQPAPLIIAKLERPEALDNLHPILHACDGVMVARGDLGVEMPPSTVPIAQKRIIEAANRHAKLVITATQMLESMIHNPRPTRAEASDVANAIFDGTDAVMLSAETAVGQYPIETVTMMSSIIEQAEAHFSEWGHCEGSEPADTSDDAIALTHAVRELAQDRQVSAVAVFTHSSRTALLMSKARPAISILAFTPETFAYQRMGLYWGVIPFQVPHAKTAEDMITHVENAMVTMTSVHPGDHIVLIAGFPVGLRRPPNFALLHTVGDQSRG